MTSGKSAHSCSFLNSLDLFQEPHPRVLVLGLQSVLCQLCKEPPPQQAVELLRAPGTSCGSGVHCSALCGAASE